MDHHYLLDVMIKIMITLNYRINIFY